MTKCKYCEKESTYGVSIDCKKITLCDYCYYWLKYKYPGKKIIVDSHLVTKEGIEQRKRAINEFLLPKFKETIKCFCEVNNLSQYELIDCIRSIGAK